VHYAVHGLWNTFSASHAAISSGFLLPPLALVLSLSFRLASAAIALGLDHLLIDPIMTLIFGNSNFYRSRGYYYNANLGELAREAD
jgi:hypothetical protein